MCCEAGCTSRADAAGSGLHSVRMNCWPFLRKRATEERDRKTRSGNRHRPEKARERELCGTRAGRDRCGTSPKRKGLPVKDCPTPRTCGGALSSKSLRLDRQARLNCKQSPFLICNSDYFVCSLPLLAMSQ